MKYSWLLFDADETLLDFTNASKRSFFQSFKDIDQECSEEIFEIYEEINAQVWKDFSMEKIDAVELRDRRFTLLFEELEIDGIKGREFNDIYLQNLIHATELYHGVNELLEDLKQEFTISLITNGLQEVQRPRLRKTGIYDHFDSIVVSDEIGIAKPQTGFFEYAHQTISTNIPKDKMLVIGDNLHSDIQGGINYGVDTCWIHGGKTNDSDIVPTHDIEHISHFSDLISSLKD